MLKRDFVARIAGWKGNSFYIGNVKMASVRLKKIKRGYMVTLRQAERATTGQVLKIRKTVKKTARLEDAYRLMQKLKEDVSADFREWIG